MLKYENITKKILAAAFKVHSTIGNGFQEVIYQRAMALELPFHDLAFNKEMEMPIYYREIQIGTRRVDFFVEGLIMVELKALIKLEDVHIAQTLNYLEAYNTEIGMLINFGSKSLEYHRLTNKKYNPKLQ